MPSLSAPLLAAVLLFVLTARPAVAASSLAEKLYLSFLPPNAAAMAVAPPSIFFAETPIVIRYTLFGAIAIYDAQAPCHPTALSFFGTRDPIPSALCGRDANAILQSYTLYRSLRREFPPEMAVFAKYLRSLGLEPDSTSTDRTTLHGMANFLGSRIADFFAKDGFNSLGDADKSYPTLPFQDFTSYSPVNPPGIRPTQIKFPLRWQPQVFPVPGNGRFASQVHVVPHIGRTVRPLVLTPAQSAARAVSGFFKRKDKRGRISLVDRRISRNLLREVLDANARLTAEQRFLARWWENKLVSTAAISTYYERAAGLSRFEIAQQFVGEMVSQHEALILAWREKRRFDQARPRTVLQRMGPGTKFRAFLSEEKGFGTVTAETWRPLVNEQPHSEFPSGSAALCGAAMEHIQMYVRNKLGRKRIPGIKIRYPKGSLPLFMRQDRTVWFDDAVAAGRSCATSRLWAGVHFRPAIDAGMQIGKGIGAIVFEHFKQLGEGVVPANCERCKGPKVLQADPSPVARAARGAAGAGASAGAGVLQGGGRGGGSERGDA